MENETDPLTGKVWVPYINNKREDWTYLCDSNRIICKEDEILWRFEYYLQKDQFSTHILMPSPNDIDTGNNSSKAVSRGEKVKVKVSPINGS